MFLDAGKILERKPVLQSRISHYHQQLFSPLLDFRVYTSKELANLPICQETGICKQFMLNVQDS